MTSCARIATPSVAIVGGGPAGLMAAEALTLAGVQVDLFDAMPSVGRKFLLAGKGGMNLTHSEPFETFLTRYGARHAELAPMLTAFGPEAVRAWALELGVSTFVGSSGRVFPGDMKAAPLLRAWLHRLRQAGVRFHMRHRWLGWQAACTGPGGDALCFATPDGERVVSANALVLALGGASWPRLGSNGAWVPLLAQRGVALAPLQPANCGFDVGWSAYFSSRFAGQPLITVAITFADRDGAVVRQRGQLVITEGGVEGGLIYAASAALREQIAHQGYGLIQLDLLPDLDLPRVVAEVARPRGSRSLSSHLQSRVGIKGVKAGLLRELVCAQDLADPLRLAALLKALPLRVHAARPIEEAISSAGGVAFEALDRQLMLRALPGVFCAGEMLDWEAPTGGYLLTACLASGRAAGFAAGAWLNDSGGISSS